MQRDARSQGVASHAALDDGETLTARLLARESMTRQDTHGRLSALGDGELVACGASGEAVAMLAREGVPGAEDALDRQSSWLLEDSPRGESGVLFRNEGATEMWADTLYHVMPFLVVIGHDGEADDQFRLHRERLRNPETRLWACHDDDVRPGTVGGRCLAEANGWVATGLARAVRLGVGWLDEGLRSRWVGEAVDVIEACVEHERPDGRFRCTLDEVEGSPDGAAGLMFAFAAFTGVADGWLDIRWASRARRWLDATLEHVDDDGVIREVCSSGERGASAEAQAFAILALAAARRVE